MADLIVSQAEADQLFAMEKVKSNDDPVQLPGPGERASIPLTSKDKRENFAIDFSRSQIRLTKATYQNRTRQVVILRRLDLDGPPHRNPDGIEIACPHLHEYREGYGDKWAIPAPPGLFMSTLNLSTTLTEFLNYCNVTELPPMQGSLI